MTQGINQSKYERSMEQFAALLTGASDVPLRKRHHYVQRMNELQLLFSDPSPERVQRYISRVKADQRPQDLANVQRLTVSSGATGKQYTQPVILNPEY